MKYFKFLILSSFFFSNIYSQQTDALIIYDTANSDELQQTIDFINFSGGHVRHVFEPEIILAFIPEGLEDYLKNTNSHIIDILRNPVDKNQFTTKTSKHAANAFNNMYSSGFSKNSSMPTPLANCLVSANEMENTQKRPAIGEMNNSINQSSGPLSNNPFTDSYLLGSSTVSLCLMESNGSLENWNDSAEERTISEVVQGLNRFSEQGYALDIFLRWHYDINYAIPTTYEPITGHSMPYVHNLTWNFEWIDDALSYLGVNDEWVGVYEYVNEQRGNNNTDWGYMVFIVMDDNDDDHMFTDERFAYAYLDRPLMVMTYNNDGWGPSRMDEVCQHETGHIFGALDEYSESGCTTSELGGYLDFVNGNCENSNPSSIPCVMRSNVSVYDLCYYSKGQIGWYDHDSDGIMKPIDMNYDRWFTFTNVYPGEWVEIYNTNNQLIKSMQLSSFNTVGPNNANGYVPVWDGSNNNGEIVAQANYKIYVDGNHKDNSDIHYESTSSFTDIKYDLYDDKLLFLPNRLLHIRCDIYNEDDELILQPWKDELAPAYEYSKVDISGLQEGNYTAKFFGWHPDGHNTQITSYTFIAHYFNYLKSLASTNESLNENATATNNGRRIEIDGTSYQYRHLVFASGGEIFYRRRPVWTSIWGEPISLSIGNQENNYPNISTQDNGRIIVIWQRKVSSNSYEIWIAKSDDNGVTWDSDDIYRLTTVSISSDPFPVVQADYDGSYFDIVFRNSNGLRSYTSSDGEVWYGTTFVHNNNPGDSRPSLANDHAFGNTSMVYETSTNEIYYRWRTSYLGYTQNWSYRTNLSSIIPGSYYSHVEPSIASDPAGEGSDIHIVWHRIYGSGSSKYNHSIIYRHGSDYYPYYWQNEYTAIYYENQQQPIVTATDDYTYIYYQLITDDNIYRQKYNGYSWTGPEYVANGRYPSISTGKKSALPVWTSNSNSPYEVKVGSQTLSKISETETVDPRNYYNRSIAIIDSTGNFFELILKNIVINKYDGTSVKLPFEKVSLDTFKLSVNNCWDLQTSEFVTVPENAESLFVNYEIKTSNYNKISSNTISDHKIIVGIENQTNKNLKTNNDLQLSADYSTKTENRKSSFYIRDIQKDNIKVSVRLDNLVASKNSFASLGHIYDYNKLSNEKEKTVFAKLNEQSASTPDIYADKLHIHPNPFNSQVKIQFNLNESQEAVLNVYNINGQLMNRVVAGLLNKGNHSYKFNGDKLSSGIYIVELKTKNKRIVNRMLLIK